MGTSKSRRDEINTAIGVESKYRIKQICNRFATRNQWFKKIETKK